MFGNGNDWEPDIAADPNAPYVYWVTTRYGQADAACDRCPHPSLVYRVSGDNGDTWGPVRYLCECRGFRWQADPQLAVASDGTVYGVMLQGKGDGHWATALVKSTDHGQTFSQATDIAPNTEVTDHPALTISPDGQDIFVGLNGPNKMTSDSFMVASHSGGQTFEDPVRTSPPSDNKERQYYHYEGAVTAGGVIDIPVTSMAMPARGTVRYYDIRSTDNGSTWTQIPLGTFKEQPDCAKDRCPHNHLGGLISLASDGAGNLVAAVAGTNVASQGQAIFTRTSSDHGATWTPLLRVSPLFAGNRRVIASFPQVTGASKCDFRMWWMDDRNNINSWNTWATSSTDCGLTWGTQERISDAPDGARYKHPAGFVADYGDYGGIAMLSDGRTIATWGEGWSYDGPGGTWVNRQSP